MRCPNRLSRVPACAGLSVRVAKSGLQCRHACCGAPEYSTASAVSGHSAPSDARRVPGPRQPSGWRSGPFARRPGRPRRGGGQALRPLTWLTLRAPLRRERRSRDPRALLCLRPYVCAIVHCNQARSPGQCGEGFRRSQIVHEGTNSGSRMSPTGRGDRAETISGQSVARGLVPRGGHQRRERTIPREASPRATLD